MKSWELRATLLSRDQTGVSHSLRMPTLTDDGHVISRERTLNIRIPKGIRAGQQIRLAGQGELGQEGWSLAICI